MKNTKQTNLKPLTLLLILTSVFASASPVQAKTMKVELSDLFLANLFLKASQSPLVERVTTSVKENYGIDDPNKILSGGFDTFAVCNSKANTCTHNVIYIIRDPKSEESVEVNIKSTHTYDSIKSETWNESAKVTNISLTVRE